jgi:hypothetical protein
MNVLTSRKGLSLQKVRLNVDDVDCPVSSVLAWRETWGVCYGRFTGKTPVANLSPEPDMRDVTKRAVKILSQRHIPPPSFAGYLGTVYSMDYRWVFKLQSFHSSTYSIFWHDTRTRTIAEYHLNCLNVCYLLSIIPSYKNSSSLILTSKVSYTSIQGQQ